MGMLILRQRGDSLAKRRLSLCEIPSQSCVNPWAASPTDSWGGKLGLLKSIFILCWLVRMDPVSGREGGRQRGGVICRCLCHMHTHRLRSSMCFHPARGLAARGSYFRGQIVFIWERGSKQEMCVHAHSCLGFI